MLELILFIIAILWYVEFEMFVLVELWCIIIFWIYMKNFIIDFLVVGRVR